MAKRSMAKRVLEFYKKNKWGRNVNYNSKTKCYCLNGAAGKVTRGGLGDNYYLTKVGRVSAERLASELGFLGGNAVNDMIEWNDLKRRRKAHVMKRLQDAIDGKFKRLAKAADAKYERASAKLKAA